MFRWGGKNRRRKQSARPQRVRNQLRFESLEERRVLAWAVNLVGSEVFFSGDGADDTLVLQNNNNFLQHNLPLSPGIVSSYDMSPAPNEQRVAVNSTLPTGGNPVITKLEVDGGGGSDAVSLISNSGMRFDSILAGSRVLLNTEQVNVNVLVALGTTSATGGNFETAGTDYTSNAGGVIDTNGGAVLLSETGTINLGARITGGSISVPNVSTFASSVPLKSIDGDISIVAANNITFSNNQANLNAAKPGSLAVGNIALTAGGTVSLPSLVTDGGSATIAGSSIAFTSTFTNINTQTSAVSGAVTLTAQPTGSISLGMVALTGSFTATGAGTFTSAGLKSNSGDIVVHAANTISIAPIPSQDSGTIAAVNNAAGQDASVDLQAGGAVTIVLATTDGGAINVSGASITTTNAATAFNAISGATSGAVTLSTSPAGAIALGGYVQGASITVTGAKSFQTGVYLESDKGNISVSATDFITVGTYTKAAAPGATTASVSLLSNGPVSTTSIVTDGGNITATGTTLTGTGPYNAGAGDISLTFTGAVALSGTSLVANNFSSTGTTLTLGPTVNTTLAGTATLNHSGAISIGAMYRAAKTNVTQNVTTTFQTGSTLYVDLAQSMPIFQSVGPIVFANGSNVYVDASAVDVNTGNTYDAAVSTVSTVTDNGLVLSYTPLDVLSEQVLFLANVISTPPGQTLQITGYVKEPIIVTCAGSCTLALGTTTSPFGPPIEVRDSLNVLVNNPATFAGLVTFIDIKGALNSSDTLTVDYRNGNPLAYGVAGIPLTYDGLGGTGSDKLQFVDSNGATNGQFSFDNFDVTAIDANSGTMQVTVGGVVSSISYAGLEPINTTMPVSNASITMTSGNDVSTVKNTAGVLTVAAPTIETVTMTTPTVSLAINGGGGTDSVTFTNPPTSFSLPGTSVNVDSENITFAAPLSTSGGNFTATGSGNFTSNTGVTLNTGTGSLVINQTGTVNLGGNVLAGSFAVTGASTYTGKSVTTANGNIAITSANGISSNALNASNSLSGAVALSAGAGNISLNGDVRTDGGAISMTSVDLSNATSNVIRSAVASSPVVFGPITMNQTGSITLRGSVSGGSLSATAGTSFTTIGTVASISTFSGNIAIAAPTGITLSAAAIANNGAFTATLSLNAGTGNISAAGDLRTDGGDLTTIGNNFSNAPNALLFTNKSPSTTYGNITMTHTGTVNVDGKLLGGSITVVGSSYASNDAADQVTANGGDISITAPGGISLPGAVDASRAGAATGSITLNASPSGAVTLGSTVTTDGGNISSSGGTFSASAKVDAYSTAQFGTITLVHSGAITISNRIEAISYAISGGGNMSFSNTATLYLPVNVTAPTLVFAQTGGGNLTFANNSVIVVDGLGVGAIAGVGPFTVASTTGTLTNGGFSLTKAGRTANINQLFANLNQLELTLQ